MIALYKKRVHVFVVSDATGMTAERVIRAALVQFSNIDPTFKKFTFVRERERIREILRQPPDESYWREDPAVGQTLQNDET